MAVKRDHLDIQTTINPLEDHAKVASSIARQNVKRTGQDQEVGLVSTAKKDTAPSDTAKPKEEGYDALTLVMLMSDRKPGDQDAPESNSSFTKNFEAIVKTFGLENVKVTFDGKETTLGEMSAKLSARYGDDQSFSGAPQTALGRTKLPHYSPMSAKDIGGVERMAAGKGVLDEIQYASKVVGADYGFMLFVAKQESSFKSNAQAGTSSARGLYQFTNETWTGMLNKHSDTLRKAGIDVNQQNAMSLRDNPLANALMGAELYKDNKSFLEKSFPGMEIGNTEIYMANFLGMGGARKFLKAMNDNPDMAASDAMLRSQASANSSFVGNKTAREFYNVLSHKAPTLDVG